MPKVSRRRGSSEKKGASLSILDISPRANSAGSLPDEAKREKTSEHSRRRCGVVQDALEKHFENRSILFAQEVDIDVVRRWSAREGHMLKFESFLTLLQSHK